MASACNVSQDVSKNLCEICFTHFSKYMCPKCNVRYCSLKCYRSQGHRECSEEFYEKCFMEELSQRKVNVEDKTKMLEILERVAKENEALVEDDDSDCSNDPLEERLAGIDLDSDPDLVWKNLTDKEKQQFHDMFQSGTLAHLIVSKPPWWETVPKVVEVGTSSQTKLPDVNIPTIPSNIPPLYSLVKVSVSSYVSYNIVNVLYSYAYTVRLFNNSLNDLPVQVTQTMLEISGVLSDNITFATIQDALQHPIAIVNFTPHLLNSQEYSHFIVKDVAHLINRTSWCGFLLGTHALADIYQTIGDCRKVMKKTSKAFDNLENFRKQIFLVQKKILFFMSWCIERGPVELPPLLPMIQLMEETNVLDNEIDNSTTEQSSFKNQMS